MRITLVSRLDDAEALRYTASLGRELKDLGHDVALEEGTARRLRRNGGTPFEEIDADLVVVVGGDGSVLLTVQRMRKQVPILGINWGEVGFLTDLEPGEAIDFFASLDAFEVEQRMRVRLSAGGRVLGDALNEGLIVTDRPAKMLRFGVYVDGTLSERFRADGLLVSTPTGSTAYAMSAGGPIVDPQIEGILLVPLAPYMLSSRPHIISTRRRLEITLETDKPAHLVIDGQTTLELPKEATLTVKKSDQPALFVNTGKQFFEKVNRKLRNL